MLLHELNSEYVWYRLITAVRPKHNRGMEHDLALEHEGTVTAPYVLPAVKVSYCGLFTKGILALDDVGVSEMSSWAEEKGQFTSLIRGWAEYKAQSVSVSIGDIIIVTERLLGYSIRLMLLSFKQWNRVKCL